MSGTEIEQVVDALAEKMGMAADKLQPLAWEVLRQYQMREMVCAIACGAICVALGSFILRVWRRCEFTDEGPNKATIMVVIAACGMIPALVQGIIAIIHYIAPLPSMLGM